MHFRQAVKLQLEFTMLVVYEFCFRHNELCQGNETDRHFIHFVRIRILSFLSASAFYPFYSHPQSAFDPFCPHPHFIHCVGIRILFFLSASAFYPFCPSVRVSVRIGILSQPVNKNTIWANLYFFTLLCSSTTCLGIYNALQHSGFTVHTNQNVI